jgi:hypothetical protein
MFATFRRFRRHVAVLTALALLASVLVAVPAVAADPEADFGATFDACGDAPDAEFTDVPSAHANAGDIDCIAYYGITKGTSATTYAPNMSVSREHMALFLVRLAGLVGIDVPSAGDTGFSDTADLSANSQAAISQLRQLEITQGTSDTTYSPNMSVTREHMALFLVRLAGLVGIDVPSAGDTGFSDTADLSANSQAAISQLRQLGITQGTSDTTYSPADSVNHSKRGNMALFIARLMNQMTP